MVSWIRAIMCLGVVVAVVASVVPAAPTVGASAGGQASRVDGLASAGAFFDTYCVRCHGNQKKKAGVALHDLVQPATIPAAAERLDRIREALTRGDMPPDGEKQPAENERRAAVGWVEARLGEVVRAQPKSPATDSGQAERAPTARRLTNLEYQNTMRDLMGFELRWSARLPKDPVRPYRFNNTAEMMQLGPEQLDLYLECARRAMASAIVDPEKPAAKITRAQWKTEPDADGNASAYVGVWENGRASPTYGMSVKDFPRVGEFRVRVKAWALPSAGAEAIPLRLMAGQHLNGFNSSSLEATPIGTAIIRSSADSPQVFEFRGRMENCALQLNPRKGSTPQEVLYLTPQNLYDDGTLNDENGFRKPRMASMPRVVIESMEFEAPVFEAWPPEHHTRILFPSPLRESDPARYVEQVLRRFITRAFRRPATDDEVARFNKVYQAFVPELKTMEAAMRETLALVLISPQFLYHAEDRLAPPLRQFGLASKLSYFLWNSMPDEPLLALAAEGKLDHPDMIRRETLRMLADGRSRDFVRAFTIQWLSLEKMRTVPINRDLFPRFLYYVPLGERAGTEVPYRPTIRDYMIEETEAFVAELIRRNANVLQIVDSDFACLNQPLAAHYGVPGVVGNEIRAVPIKPEHHLGGLLTHGSVLIGNGTGTAPHPVYRAVWLREAILGQDVAPPPADVPALSDSAGASAEKALSIKDLLAKHRKAESCNDCHARLDPWGIPFEQYNAIGRFQPMVPRDGTRVSPFNKQTHADLDGYHAYLRSLNTVSIDSEAKLPGGPVVNGIDGLKSYLLTHRRDDVSRNVLRRLTSYGIGRELTFNDKPAVDELFRQSAGSGHAMRDMIVLVCQSPLFRGNDR